MGIIVFLVCLNSHPCLSLQYCSDTSANGHMITIFQKITVASKSSHFMYTRPLKTNKKRVDQSPEPIQGKAKKQPRYRTAWDVIGSYASPKSRNIKMAS